MPLFWRPKTSILIVLLFNPVFLFGNKKEKLYSLLDQISYGQCAEPSSCEEPLAPNWKEKLEEAYSLLINKNISDEDTVYGIRSFAEYAMFDVDVGNHVVNDLGGIARAKQSLEVQQATVQSLIQILHHARPRSKNDEVLVLTGHPKNPNLDISQKRKTFRGYFEPARLAIRQLGKLYQQNSDDDDLTEEIVNALEDTARYDTSLEIYVAARNWLDSLMPGEADLIDCERFKNGLPTTRNATLQKICSPKQAK